MEGTVIVADDDKNLRAILTQSLTRAGAKVRSTATLSTLWRWLEAGEGDVVLCDVNLADGDAIDELPKMRALRPELQFVLMSAQNTVITALRAGEAGAFEYLAKPFDLREMIETLMRAQKQFSPAAPKAEDHDLDLPLIGRSEVMQDIYRKLSKIIPSDLPVIIHGETGTGKTLLAEVIHRYGPRSVENMFRYDGSNYRENAVRDIFDEAGEGSLILEKLEDYLPSEQRELLQAIEAGQYPVRLIATATPALQACVEEGRFRADLYHSLNVLSLELPPLRERIEDIEELAHSFVREVSGGQKQLEPDAIDLLRNRSWRGNIKELQAVTHRVVAMGTGDLVTAEDLSVFLPAAGDESGLQKGGDANLCASVESHVRRFLKLHGDQLPPNGFYAELIDQIDKPAIEVVLEATGGNQIRAAEVLGINRNTLRKKIQHLDISVTKGKKLM